MQISGSFPITAARAYGAHAPCCATKTRPVAAAGPARPADRVDAARAEPSDQLRALVGGRVREPAFPGVPSVPPAAPAGSAGVYQLYTRAADKVEAATAVQLGRAIDIRG